MSQKPPNMPLRRSPWRTSSRTQARLERRPLRWIDIDKIGQELHRENPEISPHPLNDHDLKNLITKLKNFSDSPYPPNALYLDLIREAWDDALNGADTKDTRIITNSSEASGTG